MIYSQEAEKMTNTSVKGGPLVQKTSLEVGWNFFKSINDIDKWIIIILSLPGRSLLPTRISCSLPEFFHVPPHAGSRGIVDMLHVQH